MYFIRKFFGLKSVCFLGRGGILYFDGKNEYYIDSENFIRNEQSRNKMV